MGTGYYHGLIFMIIASYHLSSHRCTAVVSGSQFPYVYTSGQYLFIRLQQEYDQTNVFCSTLLLPLNVHNYTLAPLCYPATVINYMKEIFMHQKGNGREICKLYVCLPRKEDNKANKITRQLNKLKLMLIPVSNIYTDRRCHNKNPYNCNVDVDRQ